MEQRGAHIHGSARLTAIKTRIPNEGRAVQFRQAILSLDFWIAVLLFYSPTRSRATTRCWSWPGLPAAVPRQLTDVALASNAWKAVVEVPSDPPSWEQLAGGRSRWSRRRS